MLLAKPKLILTLAVMLSLLCGCATSPAPVGRVVEAPQVKEAPPPQIVLETPERPVGYWRQRLQNSLNGIKTQ